MKIKVENIMFRMWQIALILMVSYSFCLSNEVAAPPQEVAEQSQPDNANAENNSDETKAIPSPIDEKLQKTITIDFLSTPIEDVLRMISQTAELDIVKSPKVTGMVTATLNNVPVGEVLDNILAVNGCGYIKTANMIRVVPISEITNIHEKIVSRVYRITYADTANVASALQKFLSSQGSLSVNPGTSNIVVTDTESKVKAIDEFIEEIDRVTEQVVVEVRIYDVTDNNAFSLDAMWNAGRVTDNTIITENSTSSNNADASADIVFDADNNPIGTTNPTGTVSSDSSSSETKTKQNVTQTTGGGIPYVSMAQAGQAPGGAPIHGATATKRSDPYLAASFDKNTGGAVRIGFFNDSVSLDLIFTALSVKGNARLLANPSIMVLDNETANFEIIKEIPYKDLSETSQGGQMTSTKFKEVGVKLEVTPHITRDGMLRMQIRPEFGIVESTTEQGEPTVNTRRLDTIALLRTGQTVVLGGLKQYETSKEYRKMPFFGDLPLISPIFRSEIDTSKESELLVFIRPLIVSDIPNMTAEQHIILNRTEVSAPEYSGQSHIIDEENGQGDEEDVQY